MGIISGHTGILGFEEFATYHTYTFAVAHCPSHFNQRSCNMKLYSVPAIAGECRPLCITALDTQQ